MTRTLIGCFDNPLDADDAASNLTEAGFKPKSQNVDGKTQVWVEVPDEAEDAARQILEDCKASEVFIKQHEE